MGALILPATPSEGQLYVAPTGTTYKYTEGRWRPFRKEPLAQLTVDKLNLNDRLNLSTHTDVTYDDQYGWKDLFGPIVLNGPSGPDWTQFLNDTYAYAFPRNKDAEAFINFHVNHDYALGTPLFPHIHAAVNNLTAVASIRFGIEYTVAKGHSQGVFGPSTTTYVEMTLDPATDNFRHLVLEVDPTNTIPPDEVEPDSIILVRIFRDTTVENNAAVPVFVFSCDIHYQADRFATIDKSPDFYTLG